MSCSYPPILFELQKHLKKALIKNKVKTPIAEEVSNKVIEYMRSNMGGRSIYIPKAMYIDNRERNIKIKKEFNGENHNELCKRYKISTQWLYKILKKTS